MNAHSTPTVVRAVDASAEDVWRILADGWLYPLWVVGAARMRQVDDTWPAIGSKLHHSVGTWPALVDDRTEVLEVEQGRALRLRAHAWPAGAADVLIEVEEAGAGSVVRISEDAVAGPGALIPKPLRNLSLVARNREALRRLAHLAEGRRHPRATTRASASLSSTRSEASGAGP